MFLLSVNHVSVKVERKSILTSGAQNIYLCHFDFSSEWEGLDKTAVFRSHNVKISVLLDENGTCQIPYEVLEKPYVKVFAGVYGTKDGKVIMPTVLADLGCVEKGVCLGEDAKEPTPDLYSQILANSNEALETARAVRADADAGKFDGVIPEIGDNGNWFINGVDTGKPSQGASAAGGDGTGTGESGATFYPAVDSFGNLSWTNDRNLVNPATVNIKGPKGDTGTTGPAGRDGAQGIQGPKGDTGAQGPQGDKGDKGDPGDTPVIGDNGNWIIGGVDTGKPSQGAPGTSGGDSGTGENGATFTPYVDASGNLSWSNDKGLANPATVNIKGPQGIQGEKGATGATGPAGADGKDGAQGPKGDTGATGLAGADGKTPVKGTDYWTAVDQASIVQDVLTALPTWTGGSY